MIIDLLDQEEIWVDAAGNERKITDLDVGHCANIANFLRVRADNIAQVYSHHLWEVEASLVNASENAYDAAMAEVEQQHEAIRSAGAVEWLNGKPLLKALQARLDQHYAAKRETEGYI